MKGFLLNRCVSTVSDIFPEYDEERLLEIRYGLEGIYLSITKVVVILFVTYMLGLIKEAIILLVLFNILRIPGFGLHASKSWMCWISSSITFIGCPFLCKYLVIPKHIAILISLFCILQFYLYAPADTKKRPLINKKKRMRYKITAIVFGILYTCLIILSTNVFFQNALLFAMLIESLLIHPLTYHLFKLPYNNYKSYVFSNK